MMDMGQITQGLRADVLQQAAGQGINVAQMMESGVSFADIMALILQNTQSIANGQGIPMSAMPQMTDNQMQQSENMANQTEMSFMPDMKNFMPNMMNIQNYANISESAQIAFNSDEASNLDLLKDLTDENVIGNQNIINNQNGFQVQITDEMTVLSGLQNEAEMSEISVQKDLSNLPDTPLMTEAADMPVAADKKVANENSVLNVNQNNNKTSELNVNQVIIENIGISNKPVMTDTPDNAENSDSIEIPFFSNAMIHKNNESGDEIQIPDIGNFLQIPNDVKNENAVKTQDMLTGNVIIDSSDKDNIEVNHMIPNFVVEEGNIDVTNSEDMAGVSVSDNYIVKNQYVVNTDNSAVMPQINEVSEDENMSADVDKLQNNIWQMNHEFNNKNNYVEMNYMPHLQNVLLQQHTEIDSSLAKKISDVVGLISPELLKTSENTSAFTDNSFVMDLLSELNGEAEIKDSFDFSESMLKIDPMQLAGLLDFISTGNGIPQALDVSDSQMFKNIESVSNLDKSVGKMVFDPEEMIKSGEMEIVSFVPAQKKSDSQANQHQGKQADESAIDIARTMKNVRENVKPEKTDDTSDFSEVTASMTTANPDEIAQKRDISFERAYAELEMNKAKYGSADEQLYKGIAENIKRGRSEFTVKLRPEGLGEILVKLVSDEGGKAILTMVASSEKTAELLNRDLGTLQSSLNQLNVEIENNSVKVAETVMHAESAFEQFNERQQDEANQQQHFRQLKKELGDISDKNASFESDSESIASSASDSALNIKI